MSSYVVHMMLVGNNKKTENIFVSDLPPLKIVTGVLLGFGVALRGLALRAKIPTGKGGKGTLR